MKIRFGTLDDVPDFVELARIFLSQTRYKNYDFNGERLAVNLRAVIEKPNDTHCFFIAEDASGKSVGCLIGCTERHFFSDQIVASVIHYDMLPEKRMGGGGLKLLTAFKKWAENRGAHELSVGINSGANLNRMDSFLRKLGFELTGGNYSMQLKGSV